MHKTHIVRITGVQGAQPPILCRAVTIFDAVGIVSRTRSGEIRVVGVVRISRTFAACHLVTAVHLRAGEQEELFDSIFIPAAIGDGIEGSPLRDFTDNGEEIFVHTVKETGSRGSPRRRTIPNILRSPYASCGGFAIEILSHSGLTVTAISEETSLQGVRATADSVIDISERSATRSFRDSHSLDFR